MYQIKGNRNSIEMLRWEIYNILRREISVKNNVKQIIIGYIRGYDE